jgi:hypoxanthine phosphoribosyltransferase
MIMTVINFSWDEFNEAADMIASEIRSKGLLNKFTHIYGIPRGGLPLAVALSHRLEKFVTTDSINVFRLCGRKMLVVDDISDSGKTLKELNPDLSATIHMVKDTAFRPTIHVHMKNKEDWIVYPWEIKRD